MAALIKQVDEIWDDLQWEEETVRVAKCTQLLHFDATEFVGPAAADWDTAAEKKMNCCDFGVLTEFDLTGD